MKQESRLFQDAGEADLKLFQVIGNHLVAWSLDEFWPQALTNSIGLC